MKRKWLWFVIGGVVVLLLVLVNVLRGGKGKGEAVQIAKVRSETVTSTVRAPGKIEPRTQVKVSADIPGKVVRLAVKEGDAVRKGQLMLQLDDTQYRAALEQSRAVLASGEARVREASTALKVSSSNLARQKALYEQKLLSDAEWDIASRNHESAEVAVNTAKEEVSRGRAMVTAAADNVSKCRFLAPFDGVVSALNVEAGEIVITGTMNNPGTQILTVSDLSRMLVRADVDETDVVDMTLGQKARITVDALPDTSFAGTVLEIGNTAKRSATSSIEGQTNFEVKVGFEENVPEIRPGMTADVEIETATREQTLAVPIQAVVVRTDRDLERAEKRKGGNKKARKGDAIAADEDTVGRKAKEITGVFVVKDGVATFTPVRTGIAGETMLEVFGEIQAGTEVVSGPYKALRDLKPGAKVKPETPKRTERR